MMNDEDLIKCVHHHEVLYDPSHKRYLDSAVKEEVWNHIGTELNTNGQKCKLRWTCLRDQFRKYLRRRSTKAGTDGAYKIQFRFREEMDFLLPFMRENKKENISVKEGDIRNFVDMDELEDDGFILSKKFKQSEDDEISITKKSFQSDAASECSEDIPPNGEFNHTNISNKSSALPTSTSKRVSTDYAVYNKLLVPDSELKEFSEEVTPEKGSALDLYFQTISATVKRFSPYYQSVFKSRVFSIVSELEMAQIIDEGGAPASSADIKNN